MRGAAAALALLLLAGCGFRPLYAEREAGSNVDLLAATKIELIADRVGQELHNDLLNRINPLGRPSDPRYRLEVELSESIEKLALRKDESATRANLRLYAAYKLFDVETGKPIFSGNSRSTSSYNILQSTFATRAAEAAARRRAIRLIGDDIHLRLGLFFNRWRGATS